MVTETGERMSVSVQAEGRPGSGSNGRVLRSLQEYPGPQPYGGRDWTQWTVSVANTSHPRPYACCVCGRPFKKKAHLQEHFLVHTGEKPFVCPQCDKRFSRARTLKAHMAVVHQLDYGADSDSTP